MNYLCTDQGISELPNMTYVCRNNKSAGTNPSDVDLLIDNEVNKGYLLGPFKDSPFDIFRISPIGIAEGEYLKKKRLIVDLSAPYEHSSVISINDLIDKETKSLTYVTIDIAIELIKSAGVGALLCKCDISDAFKLVPLKPETWHMFGIKWMTLYYFYQRLLFGGCSSPKLFGQLSIAICWIAKHKYKIDNIIHLLDDFLTVEPADNEGYRTMALLTMLFK